MVADSSNERIPTTASGTIEKALRISICGGALSTPSRVCATSLVTNNNPYGRSNVLKFALKAVATLVLMSAPALAESQSWNVSEESNSGIKSSTGTWLVTIDGDKLSGKAEMQAADGASTAYTFEGAKSGDVYTLTLGDRDDKLSGCVWTGAAPEKSDPKHFKLIGKAKCTTGPGFVIRASRM